MSLESQNVPSTLLQVRKLSKSFSAPVLRDVSLTVHRGEIHAIIGANGAGKSTFCRILSGLLKADSGSMEFRGADWQPASKAQAEKGGVQFVQQELNLISSLSVAENLYLNRLPNVAGIIRFEELYERTVRALARAGLNSVDPQCPVSALGIGQQQLVEIAGALDRDCQLLILDEPTAALTATETEILFERLRELRASGAGVVCIGHRLDEIRSLADRISVLRDGQLQTTVFANTVSTGDLVRLMSGGSAATERESPASVRTVSHASDRLALSVRGLRSLPSVLNAGFEVFEGERLGIAGLVGAGRTELLRAVFGADVAEAGEVVRPGRGSSRPFRSPSEAVQCGIALVTEDRKTDGLMLSQSVLWNSTLSVLHRMTRVPGIPDSRKECSAALDVHAQLETVCSSLWQPVELLSGGNQQKVVLSKWLLTKPAILLLDEPTRGIDASARRKIHDLLRFLSGQGVAMVMVSGDEQELTDLCDRIIVMSAGNTVAEFRPPYERELMLQAGFSGHLAKPNTSRPQSPSP